MDALKEEKLVMGLTEECAEESTLKTDQLWRTVTDAAERRQDDLDDLMRQPLQAINLTDISFILSAIRGVFQKSVS